MDIYVEEEDERFSLQPGRKRYTADYIAEAWMVIYRHTHRRRGGGGGGKGVRGGGSYGNPKRLQLTFEASKEGEGIILLRSFEKKTQT